MNNPIKSFQQIHRDFALYMRTAYGTKYDTVEAERRALFEAPFDENAQSFHRLPWLEAMPRYKNIGKKLTELPSGSLGWSDDVISDLEAFCKSSGFLRDDFFVYTHQRDMLALAGRKSDGVVTSGTGSGKTESFLLPLFAQLLDESRKWDSGISDGSNAWWRTKNSKGECSFVPQRAGELRPAAVRALVLYPMNALVEDQLARMRKALDSKEARAWLDSNRRGNRFYFGRYNGSTPGSWRPTIRPLEKRKVEELAAEMQYLAETKSKLYSSAVDPANEAQREDLLKLIPMFPGVESAEMRSRWDMQESPPDILITNFSMLSIMLMRENEQRIISKTRSWLEQSSENVFHLILDEVHLYRGTAGAEVAGLVRLLLNQLGLSLDSKQLRILCSSASFGKISDAQSFLKDFFGRDFASESIVSGDPLLPTPRFKTLKSDVFVDFASCEHADEVKSLDELAKKLHLEFEPGNGFKALFLPTNHGGAALADSLVASMVSDAGLIAKSSMEVALILFPDANTREDALLALQGIVDARVMVDSIINQQKLPNSDPLRQIASFRLHGLLSLPSGLWACACSECIPEESRLKAQEEKRPLGQISAREQHVCKEGHPAYEVLYCECCGETYLAGYANESRFSATFPDLAKVPSRKSTSDIEEMLNGQLTILYVGDSGEATEIKIKHRLSDGTKKQSEKIWKRFYFDPKTGELRNEAKEGFIQVMSHLFDRSKKPYYALPSECLSCGSDYTYKMRKSPLRTFRATAGRASLMQARKLFNILNTTKSDIPKTSLVVFSDSKEEAARIANEIERVHHQDLFRAILVQLVLRQENVQGLRNQVMTYVEQGKEEAALRATLFVLRENEDLVKKDINLLKKIRAFMSNEDEVVQDEGKKQLKEFISKLPPSDVGDFTPLASLMPDLIKRFMSMGVNPLGSSVDDCKINERFWADYFRDVLISTEQRGCTLYSYFNGQSALQGESESQDARVCRRLGGLMVTSFLTSLAYSAETSGVGVVMPVTRFVDEGSSDLDGYINYPKNLAKDLKISEANAKAYIVSMTRLLAESWQFEDENQQRDPCTELNNLKACCRAYINAFSKEHNLAPEKLFECSRIMFNNFILPGWALGLRVAKNEDKVAICDKCGRRHLELTTTICSRVNCGGHVAPSEQLTVATLRENNVYSSQYLKGEGVFRLHAEELTGQTDDQFERQRLFKGACFKDSKPNEAIFKKIDMLSVTTTMEVGVDIGDLSAVLLANMPPQRYNYQQRVGRAGRRGQAFSMALTICRSKSHEMFHFEAPEHMLTAIPPAPFITINLPVLKRIISKQVLEEAFRESYVEVSNGRQTNGEFGTVKEWLSADTSAKVEKVKNKIKHSDLNLIFPYFADWLEQERRLGVGAQNKISKFVNEELVSLLDQKAREWHNTNDFLSDVLSQRGVLPLFGMPTGSRELIQSLLSVNQAGELPSISSSAERSIVEFAPGSQKTKDKRVYTSVGFTPQLNVIRKGKRKFEIKAVGELWSNPPKQMCYCDACSYSDFIAEDATSLESCPQCGTSKDSEGFRVFKAATPAAYRTSFGPPDDAKDGGSVRTGSPVTVALIFDERSPKSHLNCSTTSHTGSVVTYNFGPNGDGFQGAVRNDSFLGNQWLASGYSYFNANGSRITTDAGIDEKIVLKAETHTDVVGFKPNAIPEGISLSMIVKEEWRKEAGMSRRVDSAASRGAVYSASYLLKKSGEYHMQLLEGELGVCNVEQLADSPPSMLLYDTLTNGAGFSAKIAENPVPFFEEVTQKKLWKTLSEGPHGRGLSACTTSCPKCIATHSNHPYHPILDWRLGVDFIKILMDSNFILGSDGGDEYYRMWLKGIAENARMALCSAGLGYEFVEEFDHPCAVNRDTKTVVVVVHPLWKSNVPVLLNLNDKIKVYLPGYRVILADTFNLIRRPHWCI
jgi:DEAD/DEAH box helicase domain-containing protein